MRQAKLVVMYSLEYYKFKFRKCSLVADKRLRSGLKPHKHIAPSCLLRLLCFLKFSLLLARVPIYIIRSLPILSVLPSSHFSDPSPRRPFSAPPLLPVRFVIRPIRLIRVQKKIIRFQKKNLSDSCANSPSKLSPALCKPHGKASAIPPQKQKNADFLKFFESKSCSVQKVAVLLHSLTEKTGMPVRSERQQKFFEKIP